MPLPNSLLRQAALGSDRTHSDFHHFWQQTIQAQYAQTAGYMPHSTADDIDISPADVLPIMPDAAMAMMLDYLTRERNIWHYHVLSIIAYEAFRAGYRVDHEYVPYLLRLGNREPHLRPYLLPLLGERGYWVATVEAELTAWVWETDFVSVRDLRHHDMWRDADIIAAMQKPDRQYNLAHAGRYLERYYSTWTDNLSFAAMGFIMHFHREAAERSMSHRWHRIGWLLLVSLAYHSPLDQMEANLPLLDNIKLSPSTVYSKGQLRETLQRIFDLRFDIRDMMHSQSTQGQT